MPKERIKSLVVYEDNKVRITVNEKGSVFVRNLQNIRSTVMITPHRDGFRLSSLGEFEATLP